MKGYDRHSDRGVLLELTEKITITKEKLNNAQKTINQIENDLRNLNMSIQGQGNKITHLNTVVSIAKFIMGGVGTLIGGVILWLITKGS